MTKMGRSKGSKNKKKIHFWSEEEKEYLAYITPGRYLKEIQNMMNEKFEYQFSSEQIRGALDNYNLKNGIKTQFKKGHVPYNKGTKGVSKPNKTSFKKGQVPANKRKVGSERVNVDGYTEIKVSEPNIWRRKHDVIYEKYNGKIPPNHVVIFADRDKSNLDINNLVLVSRKQLITLNRNGLIKEDTELTKTGINIANLINKVNEVKKLRVKEDEHRKSD